MPIGSDALGLLSAMITPAVVISACGTLIFSTAARLARVVDRVRTLSRQLEQLYASDQSDFVAERRSEVERQPGRAGHGGHAGPVLRLHAVHRRDAARAAVGGPGDVVLRLRGMYQERHGRTAALPQD